MADAIWTPAPWAMSVDWWQKFEIQPNGCKLWTGFVDEAGYGRSKGNGPAKGEVYVHRIVYKLTIGLVPPRLDVDHDCHNLDLTCRGLGGRCLHRRCGERSHLRAATRKINRGAAVINPEVCKYGHPREGKRQCPTCNRDAQTRFRKRVTGGEIPPPPSWAAEGYRDKTRLPHP